MLMIVIQIIIGLFLDVFIRLSIVLAIRALKIHKNYTVKYPPIIPIIKP